MGRDASQLAPARMLAIQQNDKSHKQQTTKPTNDTTRYQVVGLDAVNGEECKHVV
jgi:hypothetical protein